MTDHEDICAIVVTYNPNIVALRNLENTLAIVKNLFIIDNSDNSELKKKISDLKYHNGPLTDVKLHIVHNSTNIGLPKSYNKAIDLAKSKGYNYALILDQDSKISFDTLDKLLSNYKRVNNQFKLGILACKNVEETESSFDSFFSTFLNGKGLYRDSDVEEVLLAMNSGTFVKLSLFDAVGKYDEKYFLDSVDHEMSYRIRDFGYKIMLCKDAIISHKVGGTKTVNFLGKKVTIREPAPLREYYFAKDWVMTCRKYHSKYDEIIPSLFLAFFSEIFKIIFFYDTKGEYLKNFTWGIITLLKERNGNSTV